jgi:uncharacterized protein (DUF488 family)
MSNEIFSLGHSLLPFEEFRALLTNARIDAVADVRSSPFSKRAPWFNRRELKAGLRDAKIAYVFLGEELGGRPKDSKLFRAGVADYRAMAETDSFKAGLDRLLHGREKHRIAMVCSERDPLHCHRCLLIGRQLAYTGINTRHVHHDRSEETQTDAEERLLREENLDGDDLLHAKTERLSEAYTRRNTQIAYASTP